jgi:hypothetical protein
VGKRKEKEMKNCKHKWKEVKREGRDKHLKIFKKCVKCGEESLLMPNLLIDIFSIPKRREK